MGDVEQDRLLRTLLDEAAIGIKWVASDGRLVEANLSLCRLLGYERAELLQRRDDEITHPDDQEGDQVLFARLLRGEIGSYSLEKRYLTRSGHALPVRVTSALTRTDDILRLGIVEDMRQRHEGEVTLRSILNTVPDAMVIISERGIIESFSPSAERLFGYQAAEVVGKNVKVLMPAPYRERHDSYIENYVETGERRIIGIGRIVTGLRKDGTTFPLELSVGEAVIAGRRIFTGFVRDLSEREEAERRLERLQQELMHVGRLSEMSQMGSALAHELNQPLSAINNYLRAGTRMLEAMGIAKDERVFEVMDKAGAQARRAGEIIRGLRQLVEKHETERRDEDVNKIVEEASALALLGAKNGGITVRIELSEQRLTALVDRIQIQQVVVNLVRNAVEAMASSPEKRLTIATRREGDSVTASVSDSGPGLRSDIADRLFMPYVTSKEKGMGIGLSICRQIIDAHGGRIGVETIPTGGTRFFFTLPLSGRPSESPSQTPAA
ncbi:MAG TPA: PAS domain S-box protein [Stellaceae bacterium]|nr:PAS domain S-box protein [Stellaceae bacterium]